MKVADIMTREVLSAAPDCPLDEAIRLFESCNFRHLPVADKGQLVGVISDRDVALATGWILASYRHADESSGPKLVGQIMREGVHTLAPDAEITDAAELILDNRIGALPLIEEGLLVGLVTTTDLLRACREERAGLDWSIHEGAVVASAMTTDVHTISPDASMSEALDLCNENTLRHLPVIESSDLIGMISDRDLRFGLGQEIVSDLVAQEEGRMELSRTPISALMTTEVVTIGHRELLTTAADSMLKHGFSALPVLKDGELVGILTQTDILRSCC